MTQSETVSQYLVFRLTATICVRDTSSPKFPAASLIFHCAQPYKMVLTRPLLTQVSQRCGKQGESAKFLSHVYVPNLSLHLRGVYRSRKTAWPRKSPGFKKRAWKPGKPRNSTNNFRKMFKITRNRYLLKLETMMIKHCSSQNEFAIIISLNIERRKSIFWLPFSEKCWKKQQTCSVCWRAVLLSSEMVLRFST